MPKRLVIGCGYLGSRAADRWRAAGDEVSAAFAAAGFRPLVADLAAAKAPASEGRAAGASGAVPPAHLAALIGLPPLDTVLFAVGYDRTSTPSMREVYVDGLRNVLATLAESAQAAERIGRFLYVSSTSVYGQSDGSWIDEESACQPTREGGRICLEAEGVLAAHPLASRAVVLRLAGLYGPGRIPQREALLRGEPVASAAEGFLNLIHVDDAASVALAAAAHPRPSPRYNVSDGHPVLRREYYAAAARLLGAPPPCFIPPAGGTPKEARGEANRRIANGKMLRELGLQLAYPSYREGLAAALGGGN